MKGILFLLSVVGLQAFALSAHAQTAARGLTLEQVTAAEAYVAKHKLTEFYLWCACCNEDEGSLMSMKKLYHKEDASAPGTYELYVQSASKDVDDYTINIRNWWVKEGKNAINLGKVVNPAIDPCSPPIPWPASN